MTDWRSLRRRRPAAASRPLESQGRRHDAGSDGSKSIVRPVRAAELRIRLDRALRLGGTTACGALVFAVDSLALRKLGVIGEGGTRCALACLAIAVLIATGVAWALPVARLAGARALDTFHGFHDRLASAIEFAAIPRAKRSLFMDAAIEDAVALSNAARPAQAVPVHFPRSVALALCLALALAVVSLFEVRKHVRPARSMPIEALELAPDDLDEVREFLTRARGERSADALKTSFDELGRLVDDIANHRIDQTVIFRRLDAINRSLLPGSQGAPKELEAVLERIGEELRKAELTRPAGEALAASRLNEASEQFRRLSARLRSPGARPDPAAIDRTRDALRKAAAGVAQRRRELEEGRRRLADDLLKQRADARDGGVDGEPSLLDEKKRELERLDRDVNDSQSSMQKSVERLDRELEQAAADLAKELGLGADDLEQGAEEINRMAEQKMTSEAKERLRDKLRELRELVRQQGGAAGKQRLVRVQRFGRMARGEGEPEGGPSGLGGSGEQGSDPPGDGPEGRSGSDPKGSAGQDRSGDHQRDGAGGETWVLGPNGEKVLMLSKGMSSRDRASAGGRDGSGTGAGGRSWGDGHDPNIRGQATELKSGAVDTEISGSNTGQGPTRSQAILGAAERGFVSRGYKKVFTEYESVAEESLAKEDIPGGYRYYVKRYFQLIRPRDGR